MVLTISGPLPLPVSPMLSSPHPAAADTSPHNPIAHNARNSLVRNILTLLPSAADRPC
jgi:hypothetical protein